MSIIILPLPAVRDFTRDGRWSTYDESVRKKRGGGICAETETVFLNEYGAPESIPRNEFRQSM